MLKINQILNKFQFLFDSYFLTFSSYQIRRMKQYETFKFFLLLNTMESASTTTTTTPQQPTPPEGIAVVPTLLEICTNYLAKHLKTLDIHIQQIPLDLVEIVLHTFTVNKVLSLEVKNLIQIRTFCFFSLKIFNIVHFHAGNVIFERNLRLKMNA